MHWDCNAEHISAAFSHSREDLLDKIIAPLMSHSPTIVPNRNAEPFLRWVGGKQQIVSTLRSFLPADIHERKYWEPFVGAGSLFFSVRPKMAVVSDLNPHLINCYVQLKNNPSLVGRYLRSHAVNDSDQYYYKVREIYNLNKRLSAAQAARFVYLNRTCFNGIFRVNKKGQFNVPYGYKDIPLIPNQEQLRSVSSALKSTALHSGSFEHSMKNCQLGDFIYLDPPYPPLNETSYFTHYTSDRFTEIDQIKLADSVRSVDTKGCLFLLSNADTPSIRHLYRGFNIFQIDVRRSVTCKNVKHKVAELLITNYKVADLPGITQIPVHKIYHK